MTRFVSFFGYLQR